MDFAFYGNNNVVAMMRRMNDLPRMILGRAVKKPTVQDLAIPTATPPFRLGYKPTNDDLLEMEVRRMACVRTYVIHLLGTYVTILCNWLIL